MRFLKSKNISKFNISDQTLFSNPYGRTVMNGTGALLLPKGTTVQRPYISGTERTPHGPNGYIRYNTSNNTIEGYVNGVWETIRASSASAITKQTFGPGNGTETVFGPLTTIPAGTGYRASADNIIVLVENVIQISTTNFSVQQSVSGSLTGPGAPYADGWYVKFTSPVPATGGGGNPVYVTVYHGYAD